MGACRLCGESAGIFRRVHSECEGKHAAAFDKMKATAAESFRVGNPPPEKLVATLGEMAMSSFNEPRVRTALLMGWAAEIDRALADALVSPEEEARLVAAAEAFSITQEEYEVAWTRLVMGCALREVLETGKTKRQLVEGDSLGIVLQKGEEVVWVFQGVPYYEERRRREYVGGSSGVSVRLARGVYYRTGSFRGEPIDTNYVHHVDNGVMAITTKHVYFIGYESKALRVPYKKLVSVTLMDGGIRLHRDAMTAKPQIFMVPEAWFAYNLVKNLADASNS